MKSEDLIKHLIQQDLKHNLLLQKLEALGFDDRGENDIDLMNPIAKIMGVPSQRRDKWIEIYISYLNKAGEINSSKNLLNRCYTELSKI